MINKKYIGQLSDIESIEDKDIFIIEAESEEDAINKLTETLSRDKDFVEYVYATGDGFGSRFWLNHEGLQSEDEIEIQKFDKHFDKKVREYFSEKPEWGELYLKLFNGVEADDSIKFPAEMMLFICKKEEKKGNYTTLKVKLLSDLAIIS